MTTSSNTAANVRSGPGTSQDPGEAAGRGVRLGAVVVGIDGSGSGGDALAWVLEQTVERIHLVRAVSPALELFEAGFQIDSVPALKRIGAELDDLVDDIGAELAERRVVEDRPSAALLDVAHQVGADAIVVGSQGHDGVGTLVGANTGRLVHASDLPTFVVPANRTRSSAMRRVVGCEQTIEVEPLVRFAESSTDPTEIDRIHVVLSSAVTADERRAAGTSSDASDEVRRRLLRSRLGDGFTGTSEIAGDDLLPELASLSEEADLIVIASHHVARFAGFLTGTLAHHLPTASRCPVAIVPIDDESR